MRSSPSLPFLLGWLVTAAALVLAATRARGPLPPARRPRRPALAPLVVAAAFVVSRLLVRPRFAGPWFYGDEGLSGCIELVQMLHGEPFWAGNTNYAAWLLYLLGYRVFGFAPPAARLVNVLVLGATAAVLHLAVRRAVGARAAWIASGWILLGGPFVAHAIYATEIGLGLAPAAVALLLLSGPPTPLVAFVLGPLASLGIYVYPAACLAIAGLLAAHALVFRARWSTAAHAAGIAGLGVGAATTLLVRWWVTGTPRTTAWAGGALDLSRYAASLAAIARDLVWSTAGSFDAMNLDAPFLDSALLGFVVVGVVAGWRTRDDRWRWAATGALACAFAMALASLAGGYPGFRRAFAAEPFLAFALARGVAECRRRGPRGAGTTLALAAAALLAWHDVRLVRAWPLLREPDFVTASHAILLGDGMAGRDVVVLAPAGDLYAGEGYRCALALDGRLGPRIGDSRVVSYADWSQGAAQPSPARATVVLAPEPVAPGTLRALFGRDPTREVLRERTARTPTELRAVYVYDPPPP